MRLQPSQPQEVTLSIVLKVVVVPHLQVTVMVSMSVSLVVGEKQEGVVLKATEVILVLGGGNRSSVPATAESEHAITVTEPDVYFLDLLSAIHFVLPCSLVPV